MDVHPHKPMRHIIEQMQALDLSNPDTFDLIPMGAQIVYIYRHPGMALADFFEKMLRLEKTPPSDEELESATVLLAWSMIQGLESGLCHLVGYSLNHPRFEMGVPVRTSPILSIDEDFRWARSWSRFYRIADYEPGLWKDFEISGYIPQHYREVLFP